MCACPSTEKMLVAYAPTRNAGPRMTVHHALACRNCDAMMLWPNWKRGLRDRA